MKTIGLILAALAAGGGAPQWMSAEELTSTFAGQTIEGYYPNGTAFEETYNGGGTISYRDSYVTTTGNWLVLGAEFCTFYKDVVGGCFFGHRVSENCFRFYLANEVRNRSPAEVPAQSYEVTGWLSRASPTCPPPPTV